jgi:hypothetical protein
MGTTWLLFCGKPDMAYPFARRSVAHDIDLKGLNVMVGIPAGRDLPALTVKSLLATQQLCHDLSVPFQLGMVVGSAVVQWARDEVVDLFLQSDATRLFWIDSDMVWEPDQFMRLLALSQYRDVICASYPAKVDRPTFYVNWDEQTGLQADEYGLIEIRGIGLGFTVMSRGVVEELAYNAPKVFDDVAKRELASVFRIDSVGGKRQGEDMAFFSDIRALRYGVFLDPSVDLGHHGTKTYRGSIRDALKQG